MASFLSRRWRQSCLAIFCLILLGSYNQIEATHTLLRVHIESEPQTLDPVLATGVREFQILQALFEGLTRYDPKNLKSLPGVAERWEISADGLRYTFYLRSNAKWSDGKVVTAQHFWDAWMRLLNPTIHSPYAFQLFYLKGGEAYAKGDLKDPKQMGMRVINPQTFEVTLARPVPYFLSLTSFSALAPWRKDAKEPYLISNGAFAFQKKNPQEGIILFPNNFYWGRKEVRLHGVQFRPFGDFATALKFYGRTGIDIMADLPPTQVPLLKFRSDFRSAPILRTEYFIINCKKPPLNRASVRQAMAFAISRETIANEVLKHGDLPYGFFVPPGMSGYANPPQGQEFDKTKAKALLQKAGFVSGKALGVLQILYNKAPDRELVVKSTKSMWKQHLGIESEEVVLDWTNYLKTRASGKFQIAWSGWTGDYLDPNTFLELFTSENRQNYSGWSNATYDAFIRKAQETSDPVQRAQLFRQAEKILLEEAPVIAVLAKTKTYLIQPYVRGYYPNLLDIHPLRDVYSLRP